jgi:hypothetical protein
MRAELSSIHASRGIRGSREEADLNCASKTALERDAVDAALLCAAVDCGEIFRLAAAAQSTSCSRAFRMRGNQRRFAASARE